jgi:rubrerythrin
MKDWKQLTMTKKETGNISEYLNCQSIIESQISLLYRNLSEKVEMPLVKVLLKEIELDSQKHSLLLKGVSESIKQPKGKQKECSKNSPTLQTLSKMLKKIDKIDKITKENLKILSEILVTLESEMGEEYYILTQMQTLERMTEIINKEYSVDLTKVKSIFLKIIDDEKRHIEILETVKQMTADKKQVSNTPFIKYQNPDAWFQATPPSFIS